MDVTAEGAVLTRAGIWHGVRLTVPILPSIAVFGAGVGTAAAQKGIGFAETLAMSGLVFAGVSQLLAIEIWTERWSLWAVLAVTAVTATVNMRLVLMSASLRPWFGQLRSARSRYGGLALLTDANWLIAMGYHANGGRDAGVFVGSGLALWVVWVAAAVPGFLLGAVVDDTRRFGLDLLVPIFFASMLVPLWRKGREAWAWTAAGLAALAVHHLVPGYWFIVAGALTGAVLAGALDDGA